MNIKLNTDMINKKKNDDDVEKITYDLKRPFRGSKIIEFLAYLGIIGLLLSILL